MKKNKIIFCITIFLIICIININNIGIAYYGNELINTESSETTNETNENKKTIVGSRTITDGTYTISSALNSNLVLDISGNSMNSGANVSLWKKNNQNNQKFNITYLKDGYYKMEVVSSGKYLSATSLKPKNEDNIIQSTYEEKAIQQWIIKEAGNGYYYIISKESNLYLDVYRAESKEGANIELYEGKNGDNQKFKFNKINVVTGSKTIDDGIYTINSAASFNQVLDIHGASNVNGANAEIYTRNTGSNQKFRVEYMGDGYYTIQAVHSQKFLTVRNSSTTAGANVEQNKNIETDAQKWVIKSAGNGYYYIISKCNNLYLDLQGGTFSSGTNVEVYTPNYNNWQKFKFYSEERVAKKTIEPGNYVITSALNTNKVIDVEGNVITNNTNIEIWNNKNANNQKFIITYLDDGYYTIKAFNSNKVLTVKNNSALSGANVVQSFYSGMDSQKWAIEKTEDGYYYLISKYSNMYLDIQGGTSTDGSNIEVYEKNGGKNQKFKFVETSFGSTISNGNYSILASSNNSKAVEVSGMSTKDGANVSLWVSNGGRNQSMYIEYAGDGYYTIKALHSGKLLTVQNGNVIQKEADGSNLQKWIIQKADNNGNYSIRSAQNDFYLDIYYNSMKDGTNIQVYKGNDENSQKFKLEELNYKGIDVSKYQSEINWSLVKPQIDFAMIRVGYRGYGNGTIVEDGYYKTNIKNALANGIKCGVYFFSQAINEKEGIEEANYVLEKIKGYDIKYPIAIDTELVNGDGRADNISVEDRTKAVKAFCKTIQNAGYTPIIYANKYWLEDNLNLSELSNYDVWLAHYIEGAPENKSDYTGEYTIWQYTSKGELNGISTSVDMNISYKKYN